MTKAEDWAIREALCMKTDYLGLHNGLMARDHLDRSSWWIDDGWCMKMDFGGLRWIKTDLVGPNRI